MYNGKYSVKKTRRLRPWAALALVLVLALSLGGTIAYLMTNTTSIENIFIPGKVSCVINELDWDNGDTVKEDVTVTNTGNTDAFIRAAIVVNWINNKGEYAPEPVKTTDYNIVLGSGWTKVGEYYYWSGTVSPNGDTGKLIESCTPLVNKDGYTLCVEILADAIQAEGVDSSNKKAVVDAWGVDPATLG